MTEFVLYVVLINAQRFLPIITKTAEISFSLFFPVRRVQGRQTEGLLGSVRQEIDSNGKNPGFYPTKQVVLQPCISQ